MARGINKAILVGNVGADPETRYSASGSAITNIRLATTEEWKDKQSGEKVKKTEWHRLTAFGRLAEIAAEYVRKGSTLYVEGRIETSKYEKDGEDRYSTSIIVGQMQMLGGKGQSNSAPASGASDYKAASSGSTNTAHGGTPTGKDDFDDDLPF